MGRYPSASASPMQVHGAEQGASRPASSYLWRLTCGSTFPGRRPRDAVHNCSGRYPQPGEARHPGALMLLFLFLLSFPLLRDVGAQPRSAAHLCVGRGSRRTSEPGDARHRSEPGALLLLYFGGEESFHGLGDRSPQPRAPTRPSASRLFAPVVCTAPRCFSLLEAVLVRSPGWRPSRQRAAGTGSSPRRLPFTSMGSSSTKIEVAASLGGHGRRGSRRLPRGLDGSELVLITEGDGTAENTNASNSIDGSDCAKSNSRAREQVHNN
ncbi:hypothetical protein NDU88_011689 [Pleurodeles waltl]|uniref:Uncharacterized protein n=1 Tax=Pleurodeles waltl TaxID=8319 RepID=A0AAV7R0Q8_PLEWA|nr:hypothetical protein NDU88_011689 [Pleurodeles waltl]